MGWNSVFVILQLAIDRIVERISTLIVGKADLNVRQTLSAHLHQVGACHFRHQNAIKKDGPKY